MTIGGPDGPGDRVPGAGGASAVPFCGAAG